MPTIWARVNSALSGLGVRTANGRLILKTKNDPWPDQYITFQVIAAAPEEHVDDHEIGRAHLVQLNMWSRNGFESFPNVEDAMLTAGFLFQAERDMDYNENTGHYGQSKDFLYYEEKG
jgi:hypothetical protein